MPTKGPDTGKSNPNANIPSDYYKNQSVDDVNNGVPAGAKTPAGTGNAQAQSGDVPGTNDAQTTWNDQMNNYMKFAVSPMARVTGSLGNFTVDPSVLTYANMKNGYLNTNDKGQPTEFAGVKGVSGGDVLSGIGNIAQGFMKGFQGAAGGMTLHDIISARQQQQQYENEQLLKKQQLEQGKATLQKDYIGNIQAAGINAAADTYAKAQAAYDKNTGLNPGLAEDYKKIDSASDYALIIQFGRSQLNPTQRASTDDGQVLAAIRPMLQTMYGTQFLNKIMGGEQIKLNNEQRDQLMSSITSNTNPYLQQATALKQAYANSGIDMSYDPTTAIKAAKGYTRDNNTGVLIAAAKTDKGKIIPEGTVSSDGSHIIKNGQWEVKS